LWLKDEGENLNKIAGSQPVFETQFQLPVDSFPISLGASCQFLNRFPSKSIILLVSHTTQWTLKRDLN
jgi:hypothetical protein